MNKENIYKLLSEQGLNPVMVAEALNVTKQAVYQVINDGKGSEKIAKAIAEACNQPLCEVFPFYGQKNDQEKKRVSLQGKLNEKLRRFV